MPGNVLSGSDMATARLPPRQISAFDVPSIHGLDRLDGIVAFQIGGRKPNAFSMPSRSALFGISVMPTVRSP
jgi:hypothetical protein